MLDLTLSYRQVSLQRLQVSNEFMINIKTLSLNETWLQVYSMLSHEAPLHNNELDTYNNYVVKQFVLDILR